MRQIWGTYLITKRWLIYECCQGEEDIESAENEYNFMTFLARESAMSYSLMRCTPVQTSVSVIQNGVE
jgi:hypothetical protein